MILYVNNHAKWIGSLALKHLSYTTYTVTVPQSKSKNQSKKEHRQTSPDHKAWACDVFCVTMQMKNFNSRKTSTSNLTVCYWSPCVSQAGTRRYTYQGVLSGFQELFMLSRVCYKSHESKVTNFLLFIYVVLKTNDSINLSTGSGPYFWGFE